MENSKGEEYPLSGEIDLMKYQNNGPKYIDYNRATSSKKDILGVLWLTKIELK